MPPRANRRKQFARYEDAVLKLEEAEKHGIQLPLHYINAVFDERISILTAKAKDLLSRVSSVESDADKLEEKRISLIKRE